MNKSINKSIFIYSCLIHLALKFIFLTKSHFISLNLSFSLSLSLHPSFSLSLSVLCWSFSFVSPSHKAPESVSEKFHCVTLFGTNLLVDYWLQQWIVGSIRGVLAPTVECWNYSWKIGSNSGVLALTVECWFYSWTIGFTGGVLSPTWRSTCYTGGVLAPIV